MVSNNKHLLLICDFVVQLKAMLQGLGRVQVYLV